MDIIMKEAILKLVDDQLNFPDKWTHDSGYTYTSFSIYMPCGNDYCDDNDCDCAIAYIELRIPDRFYRRVKLQHPVEYTFSFRESLEIRHKYKEYLEYCEDMKMKAFLNYWTNNKPKKKKKKDPIYDDDFHVR